MNTPYKYLIVIAVLLLSGCGVDLSGLNGFGGGGGEGSASSPVSLSEGVAHNGTAGGLTDSYYRVATIAGHQYTITLTNVTGDADEYVFYDSSYLSYACGSYSFGSVDESCSTMATGSYLYIDVDGYGGSATYTITVTDTTTGSAPGSEGSVSTPVTVTSGYTGQVAYGTNSYYAIAATAGNAYTINLSGMSGDGDLYVNNADSTFTTTDCSSTWSGTADESCTVVASSGTVYFRVYGYGTTGYTINITETTALPSEGSQASPVTITSGYSGSVGSSGQSSYYTIPVTAGNNATVTLAGLTDYVFLYVYSDSAYSSLLCSSSGYASVDATCSNTAPASAVYIKVYSYASTGGAAYTINVSEAAPLVSEGSVASPITVVTGDTGQVRNGEYSYYAFTATPSTSYTLSISGLASDIDLYVYDNDATYTTSICSSASGGTTPESCTFTATGSTVYFRTYGYSGESTYTITIN